MIRSPRQARRAPLAIILGLLALTSGCSDKTPAAPTPEVITDTLTGLLNVLGTDSKNFTIKYTGSTSGASVTVTSLRLASDNTAITPTIGVGFGGFAFDGSCQRAAALTANAASINQELVTPTDTFEQGTWCVQIFDTGTLTEPTNYTMVVKHY